MKNSMKKHNTGFTLIEMLVTVTIISVFASFALPSFSRLIESNRITQATNELVSNLLLARSEALKRRNTVTICPSSDQSTCNADADFSAGWIVFLDCDGNGARVVGAVAGCGSNNLEEIIKVGDGFDSLYLENQDVNFVSFGFSGRLAGNTSSFEVGKDTSHRKKEIVINRVGRVRSADL